MNSHLNKLSFFVGFLLISALATAASGQRADPAPGTNQPSLEFAPVLGFEPQAPNTETSFENTPPLTETLNDSIEEKPLEPGDPEPVIPAVAGVAATIRALDKFTGELAVFDVAVGETGQFYRMRVDVKTCYARVSARSNEASAFLQIFDNKQNPDQWLFSGWMFSSAPALSALDHPRYDIWLQSCSTVSKSAEPVRAE